MASFNRLFCKPEDEASFEQLAMAAEILGREYLFPGERDSDSRARVAIQGLRTIDANDHLPRGPEDLRPHVEAIADLGDIASLMLQPEAVPLAQSPPAEEES